MKRPAASGGGASDDGCAWDGEGMRGEFPLLYAMLSDMRWDDGTKRETATLLLCAGDGMLKGWLNDRALSRSVWVSAKTLEGLLERLEEGLEEERLAWRASAPQQKGRR